MQITKPKQFETLGLKVSLSRNPYPDEENLQAWDAADAYILRQLEADGLENVGKVLVLNDDFGGLAVPLAARGVPVTIAGISQVSADAIAGNMARNQFIPTHYYNVLDLAPTLSFDTVLFKIPKDLELVKFFLQIVRKHRHTRTRIVAGARTLLIHTSTIKAFERWLGPSPTSLAWRRARLILPQTAPSPLPEPDFRSSSYDLPDHGLTIHGGPGVFGSDRLDEGTALLLPHLPRQKSGLHLVDLACGTGVVGAILARLNPQSTVTCCDESFLASAAAERTLKNNGLSNASVRIANGLAGVPDRSADMIFLNPPFHHGTVEGTFMGQLLFEDSRRVLRDGGSLWVTANRHLPYQPILSRLFSDVFLLSQNPKFKVFRARKTP